MAEVHGNRTNRHVFNYLKSLYKKMPKTPFGIVWDSFCLKILLFSIFTIIPRAVDPAAKKIPFRSLRRALNMKQKLIRITANHFCAGAVLNDKNEIIFAAQIIRWLEGEKLNWLMNYCRNKKWKLEMVY